MKPQSEHVQLSGFDESVLAEVRALRDRAQLQHGLIDMLLERLTSVAQEKNFEVVELNDPLPVHRLRGDEILSQTVPDSLNEVGILEREAENSELVPRDAAWWPIPESTIRALRPNPGFEFSEIGSAATVVGFSLFGMSPEEIELAVELVRSAQRQRPSFVPVFLTNGTDLRVFQRHGYAVECLSDSLTVDEQAWQSVHDRRRLIEQKWNISQVFELNRSIREPRHLTMEFGSFLASAPKLELKPVGQPGHAKKPKRRRSKEKSPHRKRLRGPRHAT
jgi:hypothetical protein